jgi:ABC-2 type transport system permease protein
MPIHEQGYRRYAGRREASGRRWWVIARAGLQEPLRERRFLALLLLAWAPFLVRAVQIYVAANYPQAPFLAPTAATFREYLDQQSLFIFFVTIYVGAGLIANDRRANALQLYLSKPLTRIEYLAGKLTTLLVFLVGVTWVPSMLLLLLEVMFAGNVSFIRANLFVIPAITVFSAVQAVVAAVTMLALSSLSKSRRFVSLMYAAVVFFSAAVYQTVRGITGSSAWAWLSPEDTFDVLADALFRMPGRSSLPVWAAVAVLMALVAASCWILERRIRAVEVVA